MALDIFGQALDSGGQASGAFDFGSFLGSEGLSTGLGSLGQLGKMGTGIYGAMNQKDLFDSQMDLQNQQFGLQKDAYDRNVALEDKTANLDFTSGLA